MFLYHNKMPEYIAWQYRLEARMYNTVHFILRRHIFYIYISCIIIRLLTRLQCQVLVDTLYLGPVYVVALVFVLLKC